MIAALRRYRWLLAFVAMMVAKHVIVGMQLGGSLHGLRYVIATFAFFLALVAVATAREGGNLPLRLFAVDAFGTLLAYTNLLHYRAFADMPSVASLRFVNQLATVDESVLDMMRAGDVLLFASWPLLLVLARGPSRWQGMSRRMVAGTVAVGVLLLLLTSLTASSLRRRYKGNAFFASNLGLVSYHVIDAASYLRRVSARLERGARSLPEVQAFFDSRPDQPLSPMAGMAAGANVIVVQFESLQGFAMGLEIDGQKVTPNLDALAGESLWFPSFFHQAAGGRTSDGQFVSNCSLLPARKGAVVFEYADNDYRCLPTLLQEAGYTSALYQPLSADFWNSASFDPKLGFSRITSARDLVEDEVIGLGISDRSFFRQVGDRLGTLPEPWYAFLLTITSHNPFSFSNLPRPLDLGALEGTRVGHYLHTVHYTDGALGEFVERLRADGVLDRSVLVVFGDHEALTRRTGNLQDVLPFAAEDEYAWFREEKRVPLLVRLPGGVEAGVRDEVGAQIDLPPTLLSLLGIEPERAFFLGRDLTAPQAAAPAAVFVNGAVLDADRLFLSAEAQLGKPRCYRAGEELAVDACADLEERAQPVLFVTEEILEGNLVPLLRDPPESVAQAG